MGIDNSENWMGRFCGIGSFKIGDKIVLNSGYLDFIHKKIMDGKLHPFSGAEFSFLNSKFKGGVIATVTKVIKSKDQIRFELDNGEYYEDECRWFLRLPRKAKL
jgi:hypothetical protein